MSLHGATNNKYRMYNAVASGGSANSLRNGDDDVGVLAIDFLCDMRNTMKGGSIIFHLIGLDWGPISELSFHDKIETMSTPLRHALALRARTSYQPSVGSAL